MLRLKLFHEGQDDFNILTICFKQKEDGISSHTLKCGVSIPKDSDDCTVLSISMQPTNMLDNKMSRQRYSFAVAVTDFTKTTKRLGFTIEVTWGTRQFM